LYGEGGKPDGCRPPALRGPNHRSDTCRPHRAGRPYATPATNQQIAGELFLSLNAVKTHLRVLFHKFGIEDLPQNQKRARLVEMALEFGIVTEKEL